MTTFDDLGIPFPLFKAPIETCPDYVGANYCCVLRERKEHCFRLGTGSWAAVLCPRCGRDLAATADSLRETTCRVCGASTPPPHDISQGAFVSYEALRAGRAGFTKDTDFGMISREQMESGWTHGVPDGRFPGMETRTAAEGWLEVRLPKETLSELTRTPNFVSWQGDVWLFQGARPMVYIGEWKKRDFEAHCPQGMLPEEFFRQVLRGYDPRLWQYADNVCIYVFLDGVTGVHAAYYDMD